MSALFISQVIVTQMDKFQEYLSKSKELAGSYGAELLNRGKKERVLSGEADSHQLVVIVRFPDLDTVNRWHESSEYQALIPLREEGSIQQITIYEEL